jgi:hypothetical protein
MAGRILDQVRHHLTDGVGVGANRWHGCRVLEMDLDPPSREVGRHELHHAPQDGRQVDLDAGHRPLASLPAGELIKPLDQPGQPLDLILHRA